MPPPELSQRQVDRAVVPPPASATEEEDDMVEHQGKRYVVARIDEIESLREKDRTREWKPIRHHFAVGSFGVNLFRATAAGEPLIYPHDETDTGHEELFFVSQGDARFSVDDEEFDAPAGTFVHVVEPSATRGAWARDAGCVLLVIGGKPGTAYGVQDWELEEFGPEG
jgi:quercetin dioxygenase-like cupin family protein